MEQETYYVVDSLDVSHPEVVDVPDWSLFNTFVEGGLGGMIVITLLFIALFIAAWKAPKWVKEIGAAALVAGILWSVLGVYQMCQAIQMIGDISPAVVCGGLKVTLISTVYGLIIYFISLIIRVIQKPRI
ncbi:MAG: MotA/TolQ/ExbB proton channel family protein [Bacteroidales bacterium]|nr:MotA/TolQ/ExbB proton channel family protein [Bacteroidales bacterium]